MQIILYRRTFPVAAGPVSFSFAPHSAHQRHTFTVGNKVYEAELSELNIEVPDDAKFDTHGQVLMWSGKKSTAKEVFEMAEARLSGFKIVK